MNFVKSTYKKLVSSFKNDELLKNLFKNSSYLLFANFITSGIWFAQSIVLARYLGTELYGLLTLVLSYVIIINQFFDFRIFELMTKYVSEYWVKGEKEKALATVKLGYSIDVVSSSLAIVVAVSLSRFAAKTLFHHPEMASVVLIYAFSLLATNVSSTSAAILRVFDRFGWNAGLSSGKSVFLFSMIGIGVILGWGLSEIILCYLIAAFLAGIVSFWLAMNIVHRELGNLREGKVIMLKGRLKEKGIFLFYTNMTGFMKMFLARFDELALGYFRGTTEVGWYKVGKNFAFVFHRLTDPVMNALYPQLARLWSLDKKLEIRRLVMKISKFMIFIVVLIIGGTMFLAPIIIHLTVGAEYQNSVFVLRILIWSMLWIILIWGGILFQSAGRPELLFKTKGLGTLVSIALTLFLTYLWGFIGTSLGNLSYHLVWLISALTVVKRERLLAKEESKNGDCGRYYRRL